LRCPVKDRHKISTMNGTHNLGFPKEIVLPRQLLRGLHTKRREDTDRGGRRHGWKVGLDMFGRFTLITM
jgi:hypothetical protein